MLTKDERLKGEKRLPLLYGKKVIRFEESK